MNTWKNKKKIEYSATLDVIYRVITLIHKMLCIWDVIQIGVDALFMLIIWSYDTHNR